MNNGYACGEAVPEAIVMKTTDGGQSWNAILNVTLPFFINSMQKLDVISPDVVFCSAQYSNVIFRTINSGVSWDTITLPLIYSVQDYDFINANEGHVLSTMGEIYGTVDGGLTWTLEYAVAGGAYGPSVYLVSVSFSGTTGYVCGSSGLIKKYTTGTLGLPVANSSVTTMLYPNPISINESLMIKGETGIRQVEIYNNSGQLVFKTDITKNKEEIMLLLESGIYTVRITSDQLKRSHHKLVVLK